MWTWEYQWVYDAERRQRLLEALPRWDPDPATPVEPQALSDQMKPTEGIDET